MELPAYELRDKGSNLDLHVQSVVSCRLDDPGPLRASVQLRRPKLDANAKAVLWHVQLAPHDVFHATRLPFDPGSPIRGCAARGVGVFVEEFWSPGLCAFCEIAMLKPTHDFSALSQAGAQRAFLSQAGPRFELELVQAEHHLPVRTSVLPPKRRRRPFGRPRFWLLCR